MEGIVFNFEFLSKFEIRYKNVNECKVSAHIKSPDELRCENATINPKNVDDRNQELSWLNIRY